MIDTKQVRGTDVLTLIEMKDTVTVIYEREPITSILFNMIIGRLENNSHCSLRAEERILNEIQVMSEMFTTQ